MKSKIIVSLMSVLLIIVGIESYYIFRHRNMNMDMGASGKNEQDTVDMRANAKMSDMPEHLFLSPNQRIMANVAVAEVKKMPLVREINAVGIVTYDQRQQGSVTAWVSGRIDRLYVNTVGASVSTSQPLAEVYSPELVSAQQEYLLALKSRRQLKDSTIESISNSGEGLVASARQRLKLMGVKEAQIEALEKTGKENIYLPIYTPLSGAVIEKNVVEGQYVNMGDPLFAVADLSSLWIEIEVYENEFPFIKIGQEVEIFSQSYPDTPFKGRVSFIYPFLDTNTRTVKIRAEIKNPDLRLKPDMFVNATIEAPLGNYLTVPVSALMDTGKRQVVWVEEEPGMFGPHDVKVGARVGDNIPILSGLKAGDKIAVSGGYLIDSESQLRAGGGMAGMAGMDMGDMDMGDSGKNNKDHKKMDKKPAAPTPPKEEKKNNMNHGDMGDMKM